jgi:hypothetical protein
VVQQLTVRVRGMRPVPWASNEWAWRRAVADQGRLVRVHASPRITESTRFIVEVTFFLTLPRLGLADLDNLAKPVLDTLFLIRHAQVNDLYLTGALFDADDDRVFKLNLEKRLAPTPADEGVDVTITWN